MTSAVINLQNYLIYNLLYLRSNPPLRFKSFNFTHGPIQFFEENKLMLVVYLTYEIVYIFFSLAIVQGGLQAMVPGRGGGAYSPWFCPLCPKQGL